MYDLTISTLINNFGIVLEIVGFVLILAAIRAMPSKGGNFVSDFSHLGNVMSTKHPRINFTGIILVILGLFGQLSASLVNY